jgi:hypothetical protein
MADSDATVSQQMRHSSCCCCCIESDDAPGAALEPEARAFLASSSTRSTSISFEAFKPVW